MSYKKRKNKGVSLIELLIYISIFSVLMVGVVNLFLITARVRAKNNATFAVNENTRVAAGTIRDALLDADTAVTSGTCPANNLDLTKGASTTSFQITGGALQVILDANPAKAITSSSVIASTSAPCLFTKINNPTPAKPTVQVKMRTIYNAPGNPVVGISQDYEFTVSLR